MAPLTVFGIKLAPSLPSLWGFCSIAQCVYPFMLAPAFVANSCPVPGLAPWHQTLFHTPSLLFSIISHTQRFPNVLAPELGPCRKLCSPSVTAHHGQEMQVEAWCMQAVGGCSWAFQIYDAIARLPGHYLGAPFSCFYWASLCHCCLELLNGQIAPHTLP